MIATTLGRTFYDPVNGRGIYSTQQEIDPYPDWIDGIYDMGVYYFPGGVPTLRESMTPTITGNSPAVVDSPVSFTEFPDNAMVAIGGRQYQLDDGAINFTPTTIGSYRVQAIHPAYLTWTGVIHVN